MEKIFKDFLDEFQNSLTKQELEEFRSCNFKEWHLRDLLKKAINDKNKSFKELVFQEINLIKLNESKGY